MTLEAIDVTHDELGMNGVSAQMKLAKDLPLVQGDRVQLLQVMVDINAIEAMSPHAAGARDLLMRTVKTKSGSVLVAVCDSDPGVDPANFERSFDAHSDTALRLRKFFKTGAAFWMNMQARFDLETAEDVLAPQIKKFASYKAA